jgi:hypothetical protein
MSTLTEGKHPTEFLLSEGNGSISREEITIAAAAAALVAGTVLGKITVGAATSAAVAGNTGNGTMGTVTLSAGAKAGVYKLTIVEPGTNVGAFVVEDPDGLIIGNGDVASAFSAGGLAFTLADGSTDFAAGDQFTITVAAGSGKYVAYDDTAADGSQVAAGVLYRGVPNVATDQPALMIARYAEVKEAVLTGIDAAGKADLLKLGIICR